jgi:hypothetical protein
MTFNWNPSSSDENNEINNYWICYLMFVYNNFIKTKQIFTILIKQSHILARANAQVGLLLVICCTMSAMRTA